MRKIAILALLPAVLVLAGCSVWEDRSGCPGWLYLELSARSLAVAGNYPTRVSILHGGVKDTLLLTKDSPSGWIQVKKGAVELRGILGNGASDLQAWGGECDSLWAYSEELTMQAEERSAMVTLHKRFATIWFSFDDAPDTDQYSMVIRSPGEFRCLLDASGGEASARLPAIGDEALELCCLSSDTGGMLWEWDLGAALLKAGYDWGAEDLSDARVRVSLAPLDISVSIVPWEGNGGIVLEL